jgi:hypothetical protein
MKNREKEQKEKINCVRNFVICRQQYLVSYTNGRCVSSEVNNVTSWHIS